MSYWSVRGPDDGLPLYVWAGSAREAQTKAEQWVGSFPNGRAIILSVARDVLDEHTEVLDEPEDEKEARIEEATG